MKVRDADVTGAAKSGEATAQEPTPDAFIVSIYQALGDALDVDPDHERIPMQDVVDPEALVRVFNETSGATYVSFPVEDMRVTVHSDGEVLVHQFE